MIRTTLIQATRRLYAPLVAVALFAFAATPAVAAEAQPEEGHPSAHWHILARSAPSTLAPGEKGEIVAIIANLGDAPAEATAAEPLELSDVLPAGVTATGAPGKEMEVLPSFGINFVKNSPTTHCALTGCKFVGTVPPLIALEVLIPVQAAAGKTGPLGENVLTVTGGANGHSAATAVARDELTAGTAPVKFGVEHFTLTPETESGEADVEAGSHPFQLTTTLAFNQTFTLEPINSLTEPVFDPQNPELVKNIVTTLPPGLVGNTNSYVADRCSDFDFSVTPHGNYNECTSPTAVGAAIVTFRDPGFGLGYKTETVPVFNLEPSIGEPARLGFEFEKVPIALDSQVQTGKGYAVEIASRNTSETAAVLSVIVTVWGAPEAKVHDNARGWECLGGGFKLESTTEGVISHLRNCVNPSEPEVSPYLTLPTTCSAPLESSLSVESWKVGEQAPPARGAENQLTLTGCGDLPFEEPLSRPTFAAQPDKTTASTPTGLNVEIAVPQTSTLELKGRAEADISQNKVTLPAGMETNAGAANGLEACSPASAGLLSGSSPASEKDTGATLESELGGQQFTSAPATCQNASKVGTVSIHSPLLEHELTGSVFLGDQNTNPFAPLLVLYVVAEDPVSGVLVKLAGEVEITPSGQLVTTFRNTPPVPFDHLHLHLFDGGRASQVTPALCKTNESTAEFTPSSGQAVVDDSSTFVTEPNPDGVPCPSSGPLPFAPGFQTGSTDKQAGAFSPFTLTIAKPDGEAALKTISMKLPQGLAAVLGSVPLCPEPQAAEGTCGAESQIGTSTALAGLGSDPFALPGAVYLTGPYGGAPFGLTTVTDAEHVGPFNIGRIVARSTINVDKFTAAATINTEALTVYPSGGGAPEQFQGLPEMIKGLPSQIKELNVTVDRPGFQFNPTNCTRTETSGTLGGYEGTSSPVSSPFEVTECGALPFAPKIKATVKGQGSKVNGVSFDVTIETPGIGQASIHRLDLTLPKALPSRLETIQKACKVEVFEANPAACDEGSVIGEGIVQTPVFKNPLRGPAYLVGHAGAAFPDVEFVLQGEGVTIIADGKTFIEKGITFSKFETNPDAPFTKFESIFPEGPHSALGVESLLTGPARNLCKLSLSIPTELEGWNGAKINETLPVSITGCGAVLHNKTVELTKKQKLAKALKACKKDKKKKKRLACEKAAKKKYGAKKPAKKKAASKKK